MNNFAGKTAFITGGASGLGLAMAKAFAGAGMNIVLADVEGQVLNQAVAGFAGSNVEVLGIQVDVTDRDAMEQAAVQVEAQFGKVHVLCNNAGVAAAGGLDEATYDDWDWVMGVNVGGVVNGLQAFVKRIKSHGEGGHIINTASLAGVVGMAGLGIYNASKFAVVGLSEALAQDLAKFDIGVSVLCPGVVNTKIFESGRNRPEQLADTEHTDDGSLGLDAIESIKDSMIEPEQVADMVLQAVRDNQFYIFTHPELKPMLAQRYENALHEYPETK